MTPRNQPDPQLAELVTSLHAQGGGQLFALPPEALLRGLPSAIEPRSRNSFDAASIERAVAERYRDEFVELCVLHFRESLLADPNSHTTYARERVAPDSLRARAQEYEREQFSEHASQRPTFKFEAKPGADRMAWILAARRVADTARLQLLTCAELQVRERWYSVLEIAVPILRSHPSAERRKFAADMAGSAWVSLGAEGEALDSYEQALELAELHALGDEALAVSAANLLVLAIRRNHDRALDRAGEALAALKSDCAIDTVSQHLRVVDRARRNGWITPTESLKRGDRRVERFGSLARSILHALE